MATPLKFSSGGAQAALTTVAVAVDLTALQGRLVAIWCDEQAIWFSGAPDGSSTTLVTSGASAASLTSLVADRLGAGVKGFRLVRADQPFLIVSTVTSTGTLKVKVVSEKDPSQ